MLCFKKISGAKKIMDRKGEYHDFSSKIFYLTVPKKIVVEPFTVSLFLDIENIYASEVYVTIFRRIFFCLTVPKHFVEEPFYAVFGKISSTEKVHG